jgi:hypothetical protein
VTLDEAIEQCRAAMRAKYPSYDQLEPNERRLLCMAYLADEKRVREVGGNNRGKWVEAILESVGLGEGYPWCAAALNFASVVAVAPRPERPDYNPAAVLGWRKWAEALGKLTTSPKRGSVAMHKTTESTGHIGVVVKVLGLWVYSIEGNTSSGESGSQRDGDGLYRRVRLKKYWSWGFSN